MTEPRSLATRAVRAALESDTQHGAVVPPIHLSSTYAFKAFGEKGAYDYTRSGNPTRDALAEAIAEPGRRCRRSCHGIRHGGGHARDVSCWGRRSAGRTARLLRRHVSAVRCAGAARRAAGGVRRSDGCDSVRRRDRRTSRNWCGSKRQAIRCCASSTSRGCRARAQRPAHCCWSTTRFCRRSGSSRIALGADLVLHSTTKYLNGHSDVVGGAVVCADQELHEQLVWWANCIGVTGAPFDSYLTLRGLRTLHARLEIHGENAARIADVAESAPRRGSSVFYPGLQHASAA